MTTALIVILVALIILVVGNVLFFKFAERRNPPIGKFIECDGVKLHYIDRGDAAAPPVVLFHGNGSMIQDLTICGLVDQLASQHRVICFDRPGFGHSRRSRFHVWTAAAQADLFVKALHRLGVGTPVVFGHSWGTLVAIALGLRNDYQIRGLVLASGYYFPSARLDVWLMSAPAIPIAGDLLSYTLAPIISWAIFPGALRKIFAPRSVPQNFKSEFPVSLALRPTQLQAAAQESALLVPTAAQFQMLYAGIGCPVRIIHGAQDQLIEPKQAQKLHRALSHSKLELVQDAGHMVTYADATAVVKAVTALQPV